MATAHISLLANNASSMTSNVVVRTLKLFTPLLDLFAHMLVPARTELGHTSQVVMTRHIHIHYKVFIISEGQQVAPNQEKLICGSRIATSWVAVLLR